MLRFEGDDEDMVTTGACGSATTEAELQRAIDDGLLREDHHTDYKAQLAPGEHGTKSLAIDLASFAVDGGRIFIGVHQKATPPLVPIELKGQKERIDQVAHSSRMDPTLDVSVREITVDGVPGRGYLVIVIPPSPAAPHMVEHIYRGRADTTNIRSVTAMFGAFAGERQKAERDIADLVRAEIDRDPTNDLGATQAHLFIVAQPVFGTNELSRGWRDPPVRGSSLRILETTPVSSSCRSLVACFGGLSTWPSSSPRRLATSALEIGVAMTGLKGTIISTHDPLYEPIRFSDDHYEAFGVVTFAQLDKGPDETVERLLGRFGRAMTGTVVKWPTVPTARS